MDFTRPYPPDPYTLLPAPATFTLTSADLTDGERMPDAHAAHDQDVSPALEWNGFPEGTRSFVVTCYDPDAPTPMGYHHWTVADLPADVTSLPTGAGAPGGAGLPAGAFHTDSDGHTPGTRAPRRRPATTRTGTSSRCTRSTPPPASWGSARTAPTRRWRSTCTSTCWGAPR
nr:hypothetical protein GCM10025730_07890 [Promicromonospora thailandica]